MAPGIWTTVDRFTPHAEISPQPALEIEIDETEGSLRVYDPRLFREGRRAFCESLVRAATRDPGVRRAVVDLGTCSCRFEFDRGPIRRAEIAARFVEAVRAATGTPADETFPLFKRPRAWSGLTAFRLPDGPSLWEVVEAEPHRLQLRRESMSGGRAELARLADRLAGFDGVASCRVSPWSRVLTVVREPWGPTTAELLDDLENLLRDRRTFLTVVAGPPEVEVLTGWKRLAYLGMSGGAFGLAIVGLAVPGVPTVPFLLATGYYLARSSPALNERLRRAPFFGPIVRESEDYEALSVESKEKLAALTIATVVVTIVLAPLTPLLLLLMVGMSSVSLYGIARMPGIEADEARPRPALGLVSG